VTPQAFRDVERAVARLRADHEAGRLATDAYESALQDLVFEHDGRWWMLGTETSRWYVNDAAGWTPADPPSPDETHAVRTARTGDRVVFAGCVALTALFAWLRNEEGYAYAGPMRLVFGALSVASLVAMWRSGR
jgi:hypothetical protein